MLDTYSVVAQLSRQALLNYILAAVRINKQPIAPRTVLKFSGPAGSAAFVLDSLEFSLEPGTDRATLVYQLYSATATLDGQSQRSFSEGELRIELRIVPGTPFNATLQSAAFSSSQTSNIPDAKAFFDGVASVLAAGLDTSTSWSLFPNTSAEGKLLSLGFLLNGQILCLNANTVVAVLGSGSTAGVTEFRGTYDFALGLSAAWVKTNLLYPTEAVQLKPQDVASYLSLSVEQAKDKIDNPTPDFLNGIKPLLPPPFGTGGLKLPADGYDIYINYLDFTLHEGSIAMAATIFGRVPDATVEGRVDETITLSLAGSKITATFAPNPPQPVIDVRVDVLSKLGFVFFASNFALITGIVVVSVLMSMVKDFFDVPSQNSPPRTFGVPKFDHVSWGNLNVHTEGIVLSGASETVPGYTDQVPLVSIASSFSAVDELFVGSGSYHFPGNLVCHPQDFEYAEFRGGVLLSLTCGQAIDVLGPVSTTWTIMGQVIDQPAGTISRVVPAHTAVPPFGGVPLPNHHVDIGYALTPGDDGFDSLELSLSKDAYNFDLLVDLTVQDACGHTHKDHDRITVSTDTIRFGQDYDDFRMKCALGAKIVLSTIKTIPKSIQEGREPLSGPAVADAIRELLADNPAVAIQVATSLANVEPLNVLRAFTPKALTPPSLPQLGGG